MHSVLTWDFYYYSSLQINMFELYTCAMCVVTTMATIMIMITIRSAAADYFMCLITYKTNWLYLSSAKENIKHLCNSYVDVGWI